MQMSRTLPQTNCYHFLHDIFLFHFLFLSATLLSIFVMLDLFYFFLLFPNLFYLAHKRWLIRFWATLIRRSITNDQVYQVFDSNDLCELSLHNLHFFQFIQLRGVSNPIVHVHQYLFCFHHFHPLRYEYYRNEHHQIRSHKKNSLMKRYTRQIWVF